MWKKNGLLILPFFIFYSISCSAQGKAPLLPPGYAVASAHPLATYAGLEVLAKGGNAFDAAVAVSAALAVVEPYHSGLGGGGFWLLYNATKGEYSFVDGREVAPKAATKDMFLGPNGEPIAKLSLNGALAAAIPGEPAALVYIAKKYGRLSLEQSLAPAIRLAEKGFVVDPQLYYFFTMNDRLQQLQKFSASRKTFLKDNKLYQIGDLLIQKDLANTLRKIAKEGHSGFYQGEIAEKLVSAVRKEGGIWTLEDLSGYHIKERQPLVAQFRNMKIITAPLPSAGGIALVTMLNILSAYPLDSMNKVQWIHYVAEGMRLAYWQRGELGDPDFIKVNTEEFLKSENIEKLRHFINPEQATPSSNLLQKIPVEEDSINTTHFSIIDTEGNRVAATLSINFIFGSSLVAEGTGVILNDEMDDFASKPAVKNVFGILGSEKNSIAPGKRPLSSMTPTFLEMPNRIAIVGTPGGSRIPTMVLLASLAFNEAYGAISMVSTMRFHHQYMPDGLVFEPDTFSIATQEKLRNMGYHLIPLSNYYGDMQAITWDQNTNLITASSDPRHIGMASVVLKQNKGGYGVNQ
ncbi:gamma-glutamyltranspeptidase (plasmid) [Legionella adelaidensis]|uniref:Glutathione hydrolase proenzyme n=1 Tax=Legionella adelaidensis TaxID=45056 RepID=A0A0W0R5T7_9GAMM|nr:gamma-glutamyltransferase [Legionella adelaidensis]KTC66447.1 gamma-glutamyltranspeptidase [Legionella adelaidensis]VEH86265.1 gamma-glutamyltranspeptidase [Legionella adelaidensis]